VKILRKREVIQRAGPSSAQIDRLEKAGKFPRRVQLGERMVGWVESEIDDWIAQRAAERDGADREKRAAKSREAAS